MANLKRNLIRLVKNPEEAMKGAEVEYETFWTSPFLPTSVTYEAMDLADKLDDPDSKLSNKEIADLMGEFVATKLYGGQFTLEEMKSRYHGPDFIADLQEQVSFIAQGQQTNETKKFLEKKN